MSAGRKCVHCHVNVGSLRIKCNTCVLSVCMPYFHMEPHKLLEAALRAVAIVIIVPCFLNGGECKRRKLEQTVPDMIHALL